jgi:hypothetical protein
VTQAPGDDATQVRYLVWRDPRTMTDAEFDAQREAERLGEPQPWPFSEEMLSHRSAAEREAYLARLRALPRRVLPMIVGALPDWLASAPPDAEIRVFDGRCDRIERAEVLRHTLAARIRAQARGHLSLREAAAVLAAPHGRTVEDLADDLIEAASKGKLTAWRSPHAKIKRKTETPEGIRELEAFGAIFTRPEDVDAWLAKIDPERRLPRFPEGPWTANRLPTQQPNDAPEAAPAAAPRPAAVTSAAANAPTRDDAAEDVFTKSGLIKELAAQWPKIADDLANYRGADALPRVASAIRDGKPVRGRYSLTRAREWGRKWGRFESGPKVANSVFNRAK